VKIGILSDLYVDELGPLPSHKDPPDVLVLAGNIGQGTKGLEWVSSTYQCPVIYVCGNYSYRDRDIDALDAELQERAWGTHVHVLQNQSLIVRGVRFIGCTLWSDFNLYGDPDTAMLLAEEGTLDYYRIRDRDGRRIRPADTVARHRKAVRYLDGMVSTRFEDFPTVIITHHAPSSKSVPPRYRGDKLMPCFASNLDELVKRTRAALWLHGGEHDAADYMLGETRVLANPRGFSARQEREVRPFQQDYCVEV